MKKLIKYKEYTNKEKKLNILFLLSFLLLAFPANVFFFEGVLEGNKIYIIMGIIFGILFGMYVFYWQANVTTDNSAYYTQQDEISRLRELQKTCGEYHKLKNKYKGVRV